MGSSPILDILGSVKMLYTKKQILNDEFCGNEYDLKGRFFVVDYKYSKETLEVLKNWIGSCKDLQIDLVKNKNDREKLSRVRKIQKEFSKTRQNCIECEKLRKNNDVCNVCEEHYHDYIRCKFVKCTYCYFANVLDINSEL